MQTDIENRVVRGRSIERNLRREDDGDTRFKRKTTGGEEEGEEVWDGNSGGREGCRRESFRRTTGSRNSPSLHQDHGEGWACFEGARRRRMTTRRGERESGSFGVKGSNRTYEEVLERERKGKASLELRRDVSGHWELQQRGGKFSSLLPALSPHESTTIFLYQQKKIRKVEDSNVHISRLISFVLLISPFNLFANNRTRLRTKVKTPIFLRLLRMNPPWTTRVQLTAQDGNYSHRSELVSTF